MQIRAKVVEGRLHKLKAAQALLEQPFIRSETNETVDTVLKQQIAEIGEKISIRRFVRYDLGEGLEKTLLQRWLHRQRRRSPLQSLRSPRCAAHTPWTAEQQAQATVTSDPCRSLPMHGRTQEACHLSVLHYAVGREACGGGSCCQG
jgi:hypothetical protein